MRAVKDYCCCAIPLINVGIYLTLFTNFVLGITAGTLAFATPAIVGASTPSFSRWLFAILCYVAAGVQLIGVFGVLKEGSIMYRRFTTLHCFLILAVFAVAAVFIGLSGAKHGTAETRCESTFFANSTSSSSSGSLLDTSQEGQILCNIFAWVTFGVMIGLWAVLGILEIYLYLVISGYGSSQRDDHAQYYSIYSVNDGAGANDMLMSDRTGTRGDAWDSRMSMESVDVQPVGQMGHYRSDSNATVREKVYSDETKAYERSASPRYADRSNTLQSRNTRQPSGDSFFPSHPSDAYTRDPGPTPTYNDPYYNNTYAPYPPSQAHPAEGSFGRKTPRADAGGYRQRTLNLNEGYFTDDR